MKKKPFISVITPSFNQGVYIERAIKSFLNQNYKNKEMIIIDGGSSDNTLDILSKYKNEIKWVSEKDKGYADAVNKGIALSSGDILLVLSSDDYLVKDAIMNAANFIVKNSKYVLWCGKMFYLDEKDNVVGSYTIPRKINLKGCLEGTSQPQQDVCFFKKEEAIKVKGFSIRYNEVADLMFFIKLLSFNDGIGFNNPISFYQLHGNQTTKKRVDKFIKYFNKGLKFLSNQESANKLFKKNNYIDALIKLRQSYWFLRVGRYEEMSNKLYNSFKKYKLIVTKKLFLFLLYKKIEKTLSNITIFNKLFKSLNSFLFESTRKPFHYPPKKWYLDRI